MASPFRKRPVLGHSRSPSEVQLAAAAAGRLPPVGARLQTSASAPALGQSEAGGLRASPSAAAAVGIGGIARRLLQSAAMLDLHDGPPGSAGQLAAGRLQRSSSGGSISPANSGFPVSPQNAGFRKSLTPGTAAVLAKMQRPAKNSSVWQRWQVSTSSNRMQGEEVLERDRQRQQALYGEPRLSASPARSHAASVFFAHCPGAEATDLLPPGALRRVARPSTRCMHMMPNSSQFIARSEGGGGHVAFKGTPNAKGKSATIAPTEQHSSADDLPDLTLAFEAEDVLQVSKVLDAFAGLLQPPTGFAGEGSGALLVSSPSGFTSPFNGTGALTSVGAVGSVTGAEATGGREVMLLRPVFCRFLLASGLCGSGTGPGALVYHECVAAFDRHAKHLGVYSGMTRTNVMRLITGMLLPNGPSQGGRGLEASSKTDVSRTGDLSKTDLSDLDASMQSQRGAQVVSFLDAQLPTAMRHASGRAKRLEGRVAQTRTAEWDQAGKNEVWPPLPPKFLPEKDRIQWSAGIRQWEEENAKLSPTRVLALRAHTETVLRGELLAGQLLEPEALHIATRFRPLFVRLFQEYLDWPRAEVPAPPEDRAPPGALEPPCASGGGRPAGGRRLPPGRNISGGSAAPLQRERSKDSKDSRGGPPAGRSGSRSHPVGRLPSSGGDRGGAGGAAAMAASAPPSFAPAAWAVAGAAQLAASSPGSRRNSAGSTGPVPAAPGTGGSRRVPFTGAKQEAQGSSSRTRPPSSTSMVAPPLPQPRQTAPHMSFAAFFRFCVDFGIFPRHASFEEIRQIYNDAESAIAAPKPEPSDEPEALLSPPKTPLFKGMASSSSTGRMRPASSTAASAAGGEAPGGGGSLDPASAKKEAQRAAAKRRAERAAAAAAAVAAAAMAAEEDANRVDVRFMDLPIGELTDFQIRTMAFLAAVDEWLSERFTRLADLVACPGAGDGGRAALVEATQPTGDAAAEAPAGEGAAAAWQEGQSSPTRRITPPSRLQLSSVPCSGSASPLHGTFRKQQASNSLVKVSAWRLLEVTATMSTLGQGHIAEEAEVEDMFRLLLGKCDAGASASRSPAACPTGQEEAAGDGAGVVELAVFQLDKAMRKASEARAKARAKYCALLKAAEEQTPEEGRCCVFFEALNEQLISRARFLGPSVEDPFEGIGELTAPRLLRCAAELGVPEDAMPSAGILVSSFSALGGSSSEGRLSTGLLYRALALVQDRKRYAQRAEMLTHLQVLAHEKVAGPTSIFGLPAFVECLLKLALHKLANRGNSELQRCAPTWWKCTWLLTLLSGRFSEQHRVQQHEERIRGLATASDMSGPGGEAAQGGRPGGGEAAAAAAAAAFADGHLRPGSPEMPGAIASQGLKSCGAEAGGGGGAAARQPRTASPEAGGAARRPGSQQGSQQGRSPRNPGAGAASGGAARKAKGAALRILSPAPSEATATSASDVGAAKEKTSAEELDAWWLRVQGVRQLPRYVPPLDRLVHQIPDLFEPTHAEAPARTASPPFSATLPASGTGGDAGIEVRVVCPSCKEQRSPSGWGSPSCVLCSGVEELCLPMETHLFSALLRTDAAPTSQRSEPDDVDEGLSDDETDYAPY